MSMYNCRCAMWYVNNVVCKLLSEMSGGLWLSVRLVGVRGEWDAWDEHVGEYFEGE